MFKQFKYIFLFIFAVSFMATQAQQDTLTQEDCIQATTQKICSTRTTRAELASSNQEP